MKKLKVGTAITILLLVKKWDVQGKNFKLVFLLINKHPRITCLNDRPARNVNFLSILTRFCALMSYFKYACRWLTSRCYTYIHSANTDSLSLTNTQSSQRGEVNQRLLRDSFQSTQILSLRSSYLLCYNPL